MNSTRIYNLVMCGRCGTAPVYRYASGLPLCADCYYDLAETPNVKVTGFAPTNF